ncbi:response regulator receiver protein [Streptomyces sp. NPDC101776]|uniref:response regulator receiver protein n=1 Tax=Streptomyces sp. NPDC101776 TaxID=3366146 RepID=UPI00382D8038
MHHATREDRLAAALVEAADTLSETLDTGEYLRRLSDRCVEPLSAWAAGIMLIDGDRTVALAGSGCGGREAVTLELLAAQRNGGPCRESYGSGRAVSPVAISVAHADGRWPEFTERALRHGVVATFAVPVRRLDALLGALNVFVPTVPNGASDGGSSEVSVAQALADAAALGLRNHRAYAPYRALAGRCRRGVRRAARVCVTAAAADGLGRPGGARTGPGRRRVEGVVEP